MPKKFISTDYVTFEEKPESIPFKYRLSYRTALTCLIIKLGSPRGGCSLAKLNLITIALYSSDNMIHLRNYLDDPQNNFLTIRYDPTVNSTLNFLTAEGLIEQQKNGFFKITSAGTRFVSNLIADEALLIKEKEYIKDIAKDLSENYLKKLSKTLLG